MTRHTSHQWGPHKGGIRWTQCQVCDVLLHQAAANAPCPGVVVASEPGTHGNDDPDERHDYET